MKAPDGILGRIARLHPGWMALPVVIAFGLGSIGANLSRVQDGASDAVDLAAFAVALIFTVLVFVYAFLVSAIVCGRFHSRRPRSLLAARLALAAMIAAPLATLIAGVLGADADSAASLLSTVFGIAGFFLVVKVSLDLVEAERGFGGSTGRKIGTVLLFVFWIVGVFFIQARLRNLALRLADGRPVDLPMEKLELLELKPGSLAMVLTGRVDAGGFAAYGEELIRRLDGHIGRKADLPGGPRWDVEIEGSEFWLTFDSAERRILLEACGDADLLLPRPQKWLAPMTRAA